MIHNVAVSAGFPAPLPFCVREQQVSYRFNPEAQKSLALEVDTLAVLQSLGAREEHEKDFRVLEHLGLHPEREHEALNPLFQHIAYQRISKEALANAIAANGPAPQVFHERIRYNPNAGHHALAVAAVTECLCEILQVGDSQAQYALSIALQHNAANGFQILLQRLRELGAKPADFGLADGAEVETLLIRSGLNKEQSGMLVQAASKVGSAGLSRLVELSDDRFIISHSVPTHESAVFLADQMCPEVIVESVNQSLAGCPIKNYIGEFSGRGVRQGGGRQIIIDANEPQSQQSGRVLCSYLDLNVAAAEALSTRYLMRVCGTLDTGTFDGHVASCLSGASTLSPNAVLSLMVQERMLLKGYLKK